MTREKAKEIFLNRGYVNGIYDPEKWREACIVISKWLEQEPRFLAKKELLKSLENYADYKLETTDCWSGCSCETCPYHLPTRRCMISDMIYNLNKEILNEETMETNKEHS